MLVITVHTAKKVISRKETCLRGKVSPKDAHCKLGLHLVIAFVPKAAGEHTPSRSHSACYPWWETDFHLSPRTHLFDEVLEVQWQMAVMGAVGGRL